MSTVKPFKGIRAPKEIAPKLAALPYDVINSEEARKLAEGNQYSFLHVTKPEIDLEPGIDLYDQKVYNKARENFSSFRKNGWLNQDPEENFYIYKQVMDGREQVGLMCCCSADEYWNDTIKKHELTRADKEEDRLKHVDVINANAGPVFLTYKATSSIDSLIGKAVQEKPEYDFTSPDGIRHVLWVVKDKNFAERITAEFKKIPCLYVADGHHRSAAASRIAKVRREKNPNHTGKEEYNFFLAVLFPHNHLYIMDYNRTVKDLNGNTPEEFMKKVEKSFIVEKTTEKKPSGAKTFGMYMKGQWYKLTAKPGTFNEKDPVESLDVSILQNNLLAPILGIQDPRKDKRIDFIGGIRGMNELEKVVNEGKFAVSFSMFPTSIEQLMSIADNGKIMPPKSTWFEPKLRSGVVIHSLE
ncbi:MAG: DUF1015 domain-containing protein [Candidatus Riflebacteria bacterium]|nr:DUF1015 domain-containing protein [Candidatus Riflebacteria bacterium]